MRSFATETPSLPPAVAQRAEAFSLGDWIAGTPLPRRRSEGCTVLFLSFWINFSLVVSLVFTCGNLVVINETSVAQMVAQRPNDFSNGIIAGSLLGLPLLLWGWWWLATWKCRVDIFEQGLIWKHGLSYSVLSSWQQIGRIRRGFCQRDDSGRFTVRDLDTIEVRHISGKLIFRLRLGQASRHVRARLCDLIESQFVAAVLPRVIQSYDEGMTLQFGPLQVSRQGLFHDHNLLPWQQIERLELGPEYIRIRREGQTSDWFQDCVSRVPNACLLKALVEAVQMRGSS